MNGTPAFTRSTRRLAHGAHRIEERTIDTGDFRTEAVDRRSRATRDVGSHRRSDALEFRPARDHRQRAAKLPSDAARDDCVQRNQLRAAAACVANSISCSSSDTAPWTVHAITSPRYARVHHHELAARVLDLMAQHPAWHLPLGYKDGEFGAERVPSGAYLGDRDMFLFLVDGNRDLDDPTDRTHAGLFRGFILRNSDVGAAALTLDVFLFRVVCGNHIIWGFQHVAGFRRRHVGASIQEAWTTSLDGVRAALDADTANDRTLLLRATTQELGTDAGRGARDGRAATRSVAEAGRRGVHVGGSSTRRIPVPSGATCKG